MTWVTIMTNGLDHVFGQTFEIFHLFIFDKMSRQNVFDVILESEKAVLYYKKQKVKEVKKWVSPWFW